MKNKDSEVSPKASEIKDWLVLQLAQLLKIDPDKVDVTLPFESYGLDSEAAVLLSGDIQEYLRRDDLEPTLLFDYPTIEAVVKYLQGEG